MWRRFPTGLASAARGALVNLIHRVVAGSHLPRRSDSERDPIPYQVPPLSHRTRLHQMKRPTFSLGPRQTFPIARQRIHTRKAQLLLESPLNWGAMLAALILPLLFGAGGWGVLFALLLATYALRQYWRARGQELESAVLLELIDASNREQDESLRAAMMHLRAAGRHNYAVTLGRFLVLKQTIDQRLKESGRVDEQRQTVENLVDELCFGVCDHIRDIIAIEERTASILVSNDATELLETNETRRKQLNQIVEAFGAVNETCRNLDLMLEPVDNGYSLDQAIAHLSTENDILQRVHQRLTRTAPGQSMPPPLPRQTSSPTTSRVPEFSGR